MENKGFNDYFCTYYGISDMIKTYGYNEICTYVSGLFNVSTEVIETYLVGNVTYKDALEEIIKNINHYDWIYEHLNDNTSKKIFTHIIQYRLVPNNDFLELAFNESLRINEDISKTGNIVDYKKFGEDISDEFIKTSENAISLVLKSKNNIRDIKPKLAIPLKHKLSDIWEIPKLLYIINSNYKFYIEHCSKNEWDTTILYAIPFEKESTLIKPSKRRKVVALHYTEGWTNTELTKDCGLIPFLLYKNHNCDSYMVGLKKDDYIYLDTYVKGMNMDFLSTGSQEEKLEYILNNGNEIDCLLLRGAYYTNIDIAIAYKKVNPNGKIYVGLDANSHWMDRINWDEKEFMKFMDSCDVIATSCRSMQNHLNEKWPWRIEYIPNGYYNYGFEREKPDFNKKENIILTVSRLGTPPKATDILLESFAKIANDIPDWNLRLVGSVAEKFQGYIEEYFTRFPELKERVKFVGLIKDKDKLYNEYLNAKIFALPSMIEGGTPNVISEALTAGCAIAITKIDAWEDAIDCGNCGVASEINDVNGFSEVLLRLVKSDNLEKFSNNAYNYAMRNYNMETVVAKLNEMLFRGE